MIKDINVPFIHQCLQFSTSKVGTLFRMNKCKTSASPRKSDLDEDGANLPQDSESNLRIQSRDVEESADDDLGDLDIIKSPSDPKKYR